MASTPGIIGRLVAAAFAAGMLLAIPLSSAQSVASSDLSVALSGGAPGAEQFTQTVRITNGGPADAADAKSYHIIPGNLSYKKELSSHNCHAQNRMIVCEHGTMLANAFADSHLTFGYIAPDFCPHATVQHLSFVWSTSLDSETDNNHGAFSFGLPCETSLTSASSVSSGSSVSSLPTVAPGAEVGESSSSLQSALSASSSSSSPIIDGVSSALSSKSRPPVPSSTSSFSSESSSSVSLPTVPTQSAILRPVADGTNFADSITLPGLPGWIAGSTGLESLQNFKGIFDYIDEDVDTFIANQGRGGRSWMSITYGPPVIFFELASLPDDFSKASGDIMVEMAGHQPNFDHGLPGEYIFQIVQKDEHNALTNEARVISPINTPYAKAVGVLAPIAQVNTREHWEGAKLKVAFRSRCQSDWDWCRDAGGPTREALQVRMNYLAGSVVQVERNKAACVEATTDIATVFPFHTSTEVRPGDRFTMSVTMNNTGSKPWLPGTHALVPATPYDAIWGVARIALETIVQPGESHTFIAEGTAPAGPGKRCIETGSGLGWFGCQMTWKMQEGPNSFGQECIHAAILKTANFDR